MLPREESLPFEIRESPMQGLGAFATRAIPADTRLIEYAGQRLTPDEAEARYPDVEGERHHTFLFAIDDDVVIDAAFEGNEARFINHSCEPNCDAAASGDARDIPFHPGVHGRAGRSDDRHPVSD